MPAGRSNRIVIDVDDVDLKRQMYSALAEDGRSLKEWFVAAATDYLETRIYSRQFPLPVPRTLESVASFGRSGEPSTVGSSQESANLTIRQRSNRRRSKN